MRDIKRSSHEIVFLSLFLITACGDASPTSTGAPERAPRASMPATAVGAQTDTGGAAGTGSQPASTSEPQDTSTDPGGEPNAADGSGAAPTTPAHVQTNQMGQAKPAAEPAPAPGTQAQGSEGLALDECDLHTNWAGDEYCINPPPPDQGFQVHIGPDDYDNPDPKYIVQPGQETNMYFDAVSGNHEDVFYYYRQFRMRPGSHHLIVTAQEGAGIGEFGQGRRLGGSQNMAKDTPYLNQVPPENKGIGMALGPDTPISVNLHYINTTSEPVIQEAWINFWYKDAAEVTEPAEELYSLGGLGMAIQPGEHVTLGPYSCPVDTDGRILTLYGHYHANTLRFSAYRVRNGVREPVYEAFDWHEPPILEYNSITENAPSDPASRTFGGWSGLLDVKAGDTIEWECEVENQTDGVLRFTNELFDGEMCILIGDAVGPSVRCAHP